MDRIVSGIQPTANVTLGNYIGAIRQFVAMQDECELFVFIANLHAITVNQEPSNLQQATINLAKIYLASGLTNHNTIIFKQSDVSEHAELGWIMQCMTHYGELGRMTQFKDKSRNNSLDGVSSGLFSYPSLMAADILLYNPKFVPVGDDQLQHLELTRTVANRFNNRFGETFIIPEPKISVGSRIMSLQNPTAKMSKSDTNLKGTIFLLDDLKIIHKKIMSAVTDSDNEVYYDKENKPGISNLMEIYHALTNITYDEIVAKYRNSGYGTFKRAVADAVTEHIAVIQDRFMQISDHQIEQMFIKNAEKASAIARDKINHVYEVMGIGRK